MVIDTSAVVAILLGEPEAEAFAFLLGAGEPVKMSSLSLLEAAMVMESRKGPAGALMLQEFVREMRVEEVAFDGEQRESAASAWQRFGKGRHPAGLNLGDCASYALARSTGEPLLFKGGDFLKTDVMAAG